MPAADDSWNALPPVRRALLDALVTEHLSRHPVGRSIVGFDGPEGGGKKQFADHFALALGRAGRDALRTEMDAFHTPSSVRAETVEGRYRESFDDARFRAVLVEPFRAGGTGFRLGVIDPDSDETRYVDVREAPVDAVLVVHGPFLHRPVLDGIWDTTVWVDADATLRAAHIARRLGPSRSTTCGGRSTPSGSTCARSVRRPGATS